ncbi:MAG TPA: hypothetical protein VFJ72_14805 [Rubrobacteraceae bacterium]|nr:hypothetical protein [Rubrobacteraceae bacterium]
MISTERRVVTFVWRCTDCASVYDGESLLFLHGDGFNRYCSCGGRLVEDVESRLERHCRLVLPEHLGGTRLHRQLERRLSGEDSVEVSTGRGDDGRIHLFNCAN